MTTGTMVNRQVRQVFAAADVPFMRVHSRAIGIATLTLLFGLWSPHHAVASANSMNCGEVVRHLKVAGDAHHHAGVYLADGDESMYHAEMNAVLHEVHMVSDDVEHCSGKGVSAPYWTLKAEIDFLEALKLEPDDDKRSSSSAVSRSLAVVVWNDLSIINAMELSKKIAIYPLLKQHLKDRFVLLGMDWKSPETPISPDPKSWSFGIPFGSKVSKSGQVCSNATILAEATEIADIQLSELGRSQGAVGTVLVNVSLDSSGQVVGTSVLRSSGNIELDVAGVAEARASKYFAQLVNCVGQPSEFHFSATYGV